ncbi:hypothetical protein R1sor_018126 [Riccia sorocarpa]|uniref:Protein kinase domain-containing protein n=1 Tax=Riccia sorocarpa TaxID=122646 RepID=A0ABD3IAJ6_9MARC
MAPFTSRDKKKTKRDPSPGSREAGEVIPIVPPGESSKTKKTSPGSPEAGELILIVPPSESSKTKKTKSGPKTTIDERDERKRENAIIRHAWFKWFTSQANLTPMRKLYWTPDADKGRKRFENKLVELGTEAFAHLSLDPNAPLFSHYTLDMQTRLRKYVTQVPFQWTQELETWLTSDQFHSWTNERPVWVFPSTLREPRYLDPIKERARVWQEWFKKPRELSNGNSLSFKYKECEPMSDNKIRWINFNTWLTPMVPRTRLGAGLYGTVYKVGVVDSSLVADLGSHDVVFYVAKLINDTPWSNARDEMLKELFAFTVNHPTVVRPVAAFSDPKTPGLLFPWWNGTAIKKWYEIERRLRGKVSHDDGDRINRKLVFVGIGDLGYVQTTQDAAVGKRRYNHLDKEPQKWTAPELTEEKAYIGEDGKQYITYWTKSTDVFAMGWLIREICGDFFIDMSREEKLEYDREKWAMGYPTTSEPPHQTHRLRLKEALDAMVYLNISSLRDHRKTAEYWAHYFIDQLMVDPTICMRPIESTKRAAKHPDGPRDIKENKW